MKKICILVTLLSIHLAHAQNPVPNPGFENWTGGSPDNPVSWMTFNFPGGITISKVAGHSGFAAQGNVIVVSSTTINPILYAGGSSSGFPVTLRYRSFQCWYKANLVNGDALEVSVILYDTASNPVALGINFTSLSTSNFTPLTFSIDSVGAGDPSYAVLFITLSPSSGSDAHVGSTFVVDDVELSENPVGLKEISSVPTVNVYPNPVSDCLLLHAETMGNKPARIRLADSMGHIILERNSNIPVNGRIEDKLELAALPPGIYSLLLIAGSRSVTKKIIVQ